MSFFANSSSSTTMKESPFSDHLIKSWFLPSFKKLKSKRVSFVLIAGDHSVGMVRLPGEFLHERRDLFTLCFRLPLSLEGLLL